MKMINKTGVCGESIMHDKTYIITEYWIRIWRPITMWEERGQVTLQVVAVVVQLLRHVQLFVTLHGLHLTRRPCPSPSPDLVQTHVHWSRWGHPSISVSRWSETGSLIYYPHQFLCLPLHKPGSKSPIVHISVEGRWQDATGYYFSNANFIANRATVVKGKKRFFKRRFRDS